MPDETVIRCCPLEALDKCSPAAEPGRMEPFAADDSAAGVFISIKRPNG